MPLIILRGIMEFAAECGKAKVYCTEVVSMMATALFTNTGSRTFTAMCGYNGFTKTPTRSTGIFIPENLL